MHIGVIFRQGSHVRLARVQSRGREVPVGDMRASARLQAVDVGVRGSEPARPFEGAQVWRGPLQAVHVIVRGQASALLVGGPADVVQPVGDVGHAGHKVVAVPGAVQVLFVLLRQVRHLHAHHGAGVAECGVVVLVERWIYRVHRRHPHTPQTRARWIEGRGSP
ncbi:unnamed protein product [Chondrus crispus]|uniref:Uncharacterized protein n=1 Tax=Chondrus crispus TaxID=2769 RepID=R7QCL3_CHOCR|nr:unnamed protein product [Chondrus crispus]CDF35483.1 unnamed protein product [Chondrus crispus]|eukprot:XP_005715302.1 unnamed protein product [Chondrus crispus]